jgi:hypothetical protein
MTDKEAIISLLDNIRKDIIVDQRAKAITASGHSGQSLQIYVTNDGARLVGASYFRQQVEGREPGEFPPMEDIIDWVKRKIRNIDISVESLAFLIARKIAKYGTDIYQHKRQPLAIPHIIARNLEEFKTVFSGMKKMEYRGWILGALQTAAEALKVLIIASLLSSCISVKIKHAKTAQERVAYERQRFERAHSSAKTNRRVFIGTFIIVSPLLFINPWE